jgi:choline-sulfatase
MRYVLASGLAVSSAACARDNPTVPMPAAAAPTTSAPSRVSPASESVNTVVLLTVDALRGDQPWTGYAPASTPNLSQLAARSIVYTRAYSVATTTAASISGLLGSRYPSELPREPGFFGKADLANSLAPALKGAGIATFGAHGHAFFADRAAPSVGFDTWELVRGVAGRRQTAGAVTGSETADLLVTYLEKERRSDRKLFAWAHFADPHHTYVPHADFPPSSPGSRGLYDGEVAYTDAAIGRVLDTIERSEMARRTAIIVTSDHGEAFGEHGRYRHGLTLYEEEVVVPLIMYLPGRAHRVIDSARSGIDIAPTIAALLGVPAVAEWKGTSLLLDLHTVPPPDRTVIVDQPAVGGRSAQKAVITGTIKVMLDGAGARVFDLADDPHETMPISGPMHETATREARNKLSAVESISADL